MPRRFVLRFLGTVFCLQGLGGKEDVAIRIQVGGVAFVAKFTLPTVRFKEFELSAFTLWGVKV